MVKYLTWKGEQCRRPAPGTINPVELGEEKHKLSQRAKRWWMMMAREE